MNNTNRFNEWNLHKKKLEKKTRKVPFFKEGDIWWIYMGKNLGQEQNGKNTEFVRPIIIVKKFNNSLFWGIALTTQNKTGKFYKKIIDKKNNTQVVILSQLRLYDKKRLQNKISTISYKDLLILKTEIKALL